MKTMYKSGKYISTDHNSLVLYLYALGFDKDNVIDIRELNTDMYFMNLSTELTEEMKSIFESANINTDGVKAVFKNEDPRLDLFFGSNTILGVIKIRKEPKSYLSTSYNPDTKLFRTKRVYMDKLIHEVQYGFDNIVSTSTYYKTDPKGKGNRIIEVRHDETKYVLDYKLPEHKKDEFHQVTLVLKDELLEVQSRKNIDKHCYTITKSSTPTDYSDLIKKIPVFDIIRFKNGQEFTY